MFRVGGHANKVTPSVLENGIYQVVAESGNSNYSSSWWTTVAGIEDNFEEGETFTVSFTIRSSDGNGTNPPTIYIKPGMGYYSMTGKVTPYWSTVYYTGTWKKDGSVNPHLGWSSRVGTYQIKNWKIEKGSVPTPWIPNSSDVLYSQMGLDDNIHKDISGYQHNVTLNNITYLIDSPINEICSVFNGSNSYVKVDDNTWMVNGATEITINYWAYSSNWNSYYTRMFSCTDSGGFNNEQGNSGYTRFPRYVYTNAEHTTKTYQYSNTGIKLADLTAGWHMFTFIYTTDGEKIYVDGNLYSEASFTSYGLCFNKSTRLFLGCEASGVNPQSPYFNGRMSDFRLYYTALSEDDIKDLYEKR